MQVLRCTRKKLDPDWVKQEIESLTLILSSLKPIKIFLFGSAAEGKMTDQSDFDFLLVFNSSLEIASAQKLLRKHFPLSRFPVDIIWQTVEEFERKKEIGGVAYTAFREGLCLYESRQ